MARTVTEIYNAMLADKAAKTELDGLNSTSRVALWSNMFWIVAAAIWILETLFDKHKAEVQKLIDEMVPGKAKWYRQLGLNFRLGQELTTEGTYDDTGLTSSQIEAMQIIKYCSVTEVEGKLRMKVAKQSAGRPVQLSSFEKAAFSSYMEKVKFAGVRVIKDSLPPDNLKLVIDIFYDPLVLRGDGSMVDGSATTPVADAINNYLNNLEFNGEYANSRLEAVLRETDGVVLPAIKSAQWQYGGFPFTEIDEKYIPDAGYMQVTSGNLTINYREYI